MRTKAQPTPAPAPDSAMLLFHASTFHELPDLKCGSPQLLSRLSGDGVGRRPALQRRVTGTHLRGSLGPTPRDGKGAFSGPEAFEAFPWGTLLWLGRPVAGARSSEDNEDLESVDGRTPLTQTLFPGLCSSSRAAATVPGLGGTVKLPLLSRSAARPRSWPWCSRPARPQQQPLPVADPASPPRATSPHARAVCLAPGCSLGLPFPCRGAPCWRKALPRLGRGGGGAFPSQLDAALVRKKCRGPVTGEGVCLHRGPCGLQPPGPRCLCLSRADWSALVPLWLRHRQLGLQAKGWNFMLEDSTFWIFGGSIHYFRVPKEYWRDRLLKMKACGLNTLTT